MRAQPEPGLLTSSLQAGLCNLQSCRMSSSSYMRPKPCQSLCLAHFQIALLCLLTALPGASAAKADVVCCLKGLLSSAS